MGAVCCGSETPSKENALKNNAAIIANELESLAQRKDLVMQYLRDQLDAEDWKGVTDAAGRIQVIEAAMSNLIHIERLIT